MAEDAVRMMLPNAFEKHARLRPEKRSSLFEKKLKEGDGAQTFETLREDESPSPRDLAMLAFLDVQSQKALEGVRSLIGTSERWDQHMLYVVNVALKGLVAPTLASSKLSEFGRECFSHIEVKGSRVESATLIHDLQSSRLQSYLESFACIYESTSGYDAGGNFLLRAFAEREHATSSAKKDKNWKHVVLFEKGFLECFVKPESLKSVTGQGAKWQVMELSDDDHRGTRRGRDSPQGGASPPHRPGHEAPPMPAPEVGMANGPLVPPLPGRGGPPVPPAGEVAQQQASVGEEALSMSSPQGEGSMSLSVAASADGAGAEGGAAMPAGDVSVEEAKSRLDEKYEADRKKKMQKYRKAYRKAERELQVEHEKQCRTLLLQFSAPHNAEVQRELQAMRDAQADKIQAERQARECEEAIEASSKKKKEAEDQVAKGKEEEERLSKMLEKIKSNIADTAKEAEAEADKVKDAEDKKKAEDIKVAECQERILQSRKRKRDAEGELKRVALLFGSTPQKERGSGEEEGKGGGGGARQCLEGRLAGQGGG